MSGVTPTQVLFTEQQWQVLADLQLCALAKEGGSWLVTNQTPFHPVSHIWPDHPADRGVIKVDGSQYPVTGCFTGAVELATNELHVDTDIPVKRDEPGWVFVVVHYIEQELALSTGCQVELIVDKIYQQALSRGHSGGHLSSLALNKVLHHDFWRKDASRKDEMGHYDFHRYAQIKSRVSEDCSTDTYRLGKTLRKRGLNSADLLLRLDEVADRVNQQLERWRQAGAAVTMHREGTALTDSRYWQCDLAEGPLIEIPCGGTHIQSLADYTQLSVEFQLVSEQELVMVTKTISK
ncbi:alanyl-tRNA editing protein [Photobacterium sp. SDRW27]|uniref:alanyl-tRNA editing protein n=1 Tax=Photobacterium obscurum TaxID=2829490 RepID=UPI0022437FEF|nr:alanyl-tRNA editing protein [Photobacterium obscurum]MCW8328050.1 alanyl-tRNA editing protein [Photobacterium obscurum]